MPFAIVAGTGIYDIPGLDLQQQTVTTPYGDALIARGTGENEDVIFLTRHGPSHTLPPHLINYRANIMALKQLGVKRVIANYAVGGISPEIPPLTCATLSDAMNFTHSRGHTFEDGTGDKVKHVVMTDPYSPMLRKKILELAPSFNVPISKENAVYASFQGPRFETAAEIRMMKMLGADVVGMTGLPELSLAREAELCFAAVALSINWAAGLQDEFEIVYDGLAELRLQIIELCLAALRSTRDEDCEPVQFH